MAGPAAPKPSPQGRAPEPPPRPHPLWAGVGSLQAELEAWGRGSSLRGVAQLGPVCGPAWEEKSSSTEMRELCLPLPAVGPPPMVGPLGGSAAAPESAFRASDPGPRHLLPHLQRLRPGAMQRPSRPQFPHSKAITAFQGRG